MVNWKRNLAVVWVAQFLSIMGFCFAMPFAPYYIQELGVTDQVEVKMWVSLYTAATPLGMFIFSPIWGIVADRYGRKMMMLRAYVAAAFIVSLMGMVDSVWVLVALRFAQGSMTGTVTASQALVSANTPNHRAGLALGALSGALYSGVMMGVFLGGWFADVFGYRMAFILSGGVFMIPALLVWFGIKERFERPKRTRSDVSLSERPGVRQLRVVWGIMLLFAAVSFCRQFDMAMFPLLVQKIHGSIKGVSIWAGTIYAVCGAAGLFTSFVVGWLSDRISPEKMGKWLALAAGAMMIPVGLAPDMVVLTVTRFGMVFFAGGLDPIIQNWLSRSTLEKNRGLVFGWSASAKSLGWIGAPLSSGLLATVFGIRPIYFFGAAFFIGLIPLIAFVSARMNKKRHACEAS